MITIQTNYPEYQKINTKLLKHAIQLTLDHLEKPEMELTLRLTGDAEMRQLNQTFRGIGSSTDVLAFNHDIIDPETDQLYLGDIVISIDRAIQQAQQHGHPVDREAAFLTIHGTLHLLGYDHHKPEEKRAMWALQDEIFQLLFTEKGENAQ